VNVFFDNCTSPVLATTLGGYISNFDGSAHHIRTLPCGASASDLVWIDMLRQSKEDWIVITGDGRIERNKAERTAFRQAMLKGFVLAPAYQKTPVHQTASILIWRWPDMEKLIQSVAAPALYELPINRSGRFRQLPL
jgi:hypothetical protein